MKSAFARIGELSTKRVALLPCACSTGPSTKSIKSCPRRPDHHTGIHLHNCPRSDRPLPVVMIVHGGLCWNCKVYSQRVLLTGPGDVHLLFCRAKLRPECQWRPKRGCTSPSQYQAYAATTRYGPSASHCIAPTPSVGYTVSCVHVKSRNQSTFSTIYLAMKFRLPPRHPSCQHHIHSCFLLPCRSFPHGPS